MVLISISFGFAIIIYDVWRSLKKTHTERTSQGGLRFVCFKSGRNICTAFSFACFAFVYSDGRELGEGGEREGKQQRDQLKALTCGKKLIIHQELGSP